jgi:hypothetical protein
MTSRERVRSRGRVRTKVAVVIVIASLATLSFLGALIVPLYTYPGVSWNAIIAAKEANPSVAMVTIINPDNGPGASIDQNYVNGINNLRAAGIVVLGYDHTSYGARPLATVEADINSYKDWYNLSGIFFDEMANVPGYESYYSTLNQYAKSVGFNFTVGNPGSAVPASYIGTMDVIVGYEDQGVPNTASLESMTNGVPANHFAVIAYGVNVWNGSAVSNIYNYASYVYVTNDTLPNPYGALTGDFSKLVSFLSDPVPSSVPLTVNSVTAAGIPIAGVYTVITSGSGAPVDSGDTPLTASVSRGAEYVVSVANYGSFVFEHWGDGNTSPSQDIGVSGSTTVTATYGLPAPATASMTIQSSALTGASITGLSTTVTSNGNSVATGVTPLSFTGAIGESYTVSVGNSTSYVFDDWGGGSTSQAQTVTLTQNTTLTAYYTAAPASTTSTTAPSSTSSTAKSTTNTSTTSASKTSSSTEAISSATTSSTTEAPSSTTASTTASTSASSSSIGTSSSLTTSASTQSASVSTQSTSSSAQSAPSSTTSSTAATSLATSASTQSGSFFTTGHSSSSLLILGIVAVVAVAMISAIATLVIRRVGHKN